MVKVLDRDTINRMTGGYGGTTGRTGGGGGGGSSYTLPLAADGVRGGVQVGYTTDASARKYAVQLDGEKAYVNVPWENTEDRLKPLGTITWGANYLQYQDVYATAASNPANAIGNPTADWYHHIVMNHGNNAGYFVDMALCFHTNEFYYRRIANGTANAWVRVIDSSNIGNQSVSYATSAGSAGYATNASVADTLGGYYESDFLHKTGGTMTGQLSINKVGFALKWNNDNYSVGSNNSPNDFFIWSEDSTARFRLGTNNLERLTVLANGNIGIGTTSPGHKLHVVGRIYCTGGFAFLSDIRKKDVITKDLHISVGDIAKAPLIRYTLKSDEKKEIHIGSVAQYWQNVMPETINESNDGTLSMDYGTISLVSVVTLARKLETLEKELSDIKKKLITK